MFLSFSVVIINIIIFVNLFKISILHKDRQHKVYHYPGTKAKRYI
jgi:hypothetical protein